MDRAVQRADLVPLKYIYPSKLRRLRAATAVGGTLWVIAMAFIAGEPPGAARDRAAALSARLSGLVRRCCPRGSASGGRQRGRRS
jgi:hypothetical protein